MASWPTPIAVFTRVARTFSGRLFCDTMSDPYAADDVVLVEVETVATTDHAPAVSLTDRSAKPTRGEMSFLGVFGSAPFGSPDRLQRQQRGVVREVFLIVEG